MTNDTLQRFLFDKAGIRGELVHLDATWKAVLERHDYPPVVRKVLGEMMAAGVLLIATLKFKGRITLQVQGNGPISMMVVECTSQRTVRGLAHYKDEVPEHGLAEQFGDGRLAITLEPEQGERYQGIVALEGDNLSEAIEGYLDRSEQLATRIWLVADGEKISGMLLQKLPGNDVEEEDWYRVTALGATITDSELSELDQREVIHRLFHEEDIRLYESEPVSFRCNCSTERVANALRGLGHDEVMDIIKTEGIIDITCEFCNRNYRYDAVDAEGLFADVAQPDTGETRH